MSDPSTIKAAVSLSLAAGTMAERMADASVAAAIWMESDTDTGRAVYDKARRARIRRRRALRRILDALQDLAIRTAAGGAR